MAFEPRRSIAGIMTAYGGMRNESPLAAGVRGYLAGKEIKRRNEELELRKQAANNERNRQIMEQMGRRATAIKMMDPQDRPFAWAEFRNNTINAFGEDPGDYSEAQLDEIIADSTEGLKYLQAQGTYGKPFEAIGEDGQRVFVQSTPAGQTRELTGYTAPISNDATSFAQDWALFNAQTPETQERMLEFKRGPQTANLGGSIAVLSPGGGISRTYPVTLKPGETPEVKYQQAAATKAGGTEGTMMAEYDEMVARLPRLETLVQELSALGKVATYTVAGQAAESAMRQMGLEPGPGAVARTEYISKVDNEILPLLRQTFGAQFTENEGRSLKATLGDPDKTPDEKDAVLRSFIATKRAEVETRRRILEQMRQRGQPQPAATPGRAPAAPPAPEYTNYGPRVQRPGAMPGIELLSIEPE